MAREIAFDISVLNITLQPHSPEKYVELFEDVFTRKPAISKKYLGKDYISLKITERMRTDRGDVDAIFGYIQKYTVIDSSKPWYDRKNDSRVKEGEEPNYDLISFSPFYTSYEFIFLPNGHRMFVVTKIKNEMISIARIANAVERIFQEDWIVNKYNNVIVNVETDESSIDKMLSMSKLEKLFIKVALDNDDDNSSLKEQVIQSMRKQKIHTASRLLVGEKNQSILPDEETRALMELSLSNGYSIATGRRGEEKATEKTSFYPFVTSGKYNSNTEMFKDKLLSIAKKSIEYLKTRQKK